MISTDKKIEAEIRRLENCLYEKQVKITGWKMKRGFYKEPGQYDMLDQEWRNFPEGQHIIINDVTVFLQNEITLDESVKGKKVALLLKIGGESCVFINGAPYHGLDLNRNMVILAEKASGKEIYKIEVETYCKISDIEAENVFRGDIFLRQAEVAVINKRVWKFYYDIKTVFEYVRTCQEEYIRSRVFAVIYEALLKVDYLNKENLNKSIREADIFYREEMECYEGIKLPVSIYFAGHSHIDVAWHWPLKETIRKVGRTFTSALRLMEQYGDFKFCQSMPILYEMAKKYYPTVFEKIKERVKEKRWETLGCMYLEPDCNLISGESLVRQILYGKKFYKKELNSDSNICFLPDVFGFSAAMPQILKKAGTDYFFTSKLVWNETNEFPYSVFRWRGIDGTEVLAGMMAMCTKSGIDLYNGDLSPNGVKESLENFKNKEDGSPILYLYGYGDGGGGVTKEMLEALTRLKKVPMMAQTEISTVQEYFEALDKEMKYPVWSDGLYFEKHRGTYTTAAKNKKKNRKSEFLYRDAEIFSIFQFLENGKFFEENLDEGWKLILLNQFHDILPGTCIKEVYEETDRQYMQIQKIGEESIEQNVNRMVRPWEEAVTVYNTLSWERTQVIEVSAEGKRGIKKADGTYPKQVRKKDGCIAFLAENVPAMGYQVYYFSDVEVPEKKNCNIQVQEKEDSYIIENEWMRVGIKRNGELYSVYDTKQKREILKVGCVGNRLKLEEDIPVEWGAAWETTEKREDKQPIKVTAYESYIKEHNSLYSVITVKQNIHHTDIFQDIVIYHNEPLIKFQTNIDWDERQKILRVEFPTNIHTQMAKVDIAFGNVEYTNHNTTSHDTARFEICGHKWGDVSEEGYGIALLNDCKYGYAIKDSNIQLSLLRSPDYPSETCDKGNHTFAYWFYPHTGNIYVGRVAQKGYEVNVPLKVVRGRASEESKSYIRMESDHVVIDTVKRAEDGNGIIVRFYETYNKTGDVGITFCFSIKSCVETNLLEEKVGDIEIEKNRVVLKIKPYEIKTLRVYI